MTSVSSLQTAFELRIVLADGSIVVGMVPDGHDWLAGRAGQTLDVRRDTTWTTVGHLQPTVVPIDVEGHIIALHLSTVAQAEALRQALAMGAVGAVLVVSGFTSLRTGPLSPAAVGQPDGAPPAAAQVMPAAATLGMPAAATLGMPPATALRPSNSDSTILSLPVPVRLGTSLNIARPPVGPAPDRAAPPGEAPAAPAGWEATRPPTPYYDDVLTPRHASGEWATSLLDTIYCLPADYAPNDLASVAQAGLSGNWKVRSLAIDDLRAMASAARAAGAPIAVASAYRSHQQQVRLFQGYVDRDGYDQAVMESARPGHSEHQLGTALDFKSPGGPAPWSLADWVETPAGAWMRDHAWQFGFVMSYPAGASEVTGYMYEPWHYRYVGRETAASIHDSGTTTREWLWQQGAGVRAQDGVAAGPPAG